MRDQTPIPFGKPKTFEKSYQTYKSVLLDSGESSIYEFRRLEEGAPFDCFQERPLGHLAKVRGFCIVIV
jgi:hypothetical protein